MIAALPYELPGPRRKLTHARDGVGTPKLAASVTGQITKRDAPGPQSTRAIAPKTTTSMETNGARAMRPTAGGLLRPGLSACARDGPSYGRRGPGVGRNYPRGRPTSGAIGPQPKIVVSPAPMVVILFLSLRGNRQLKTRCNDWSSFLVIQGLLDRGWRPSRASTHR